MATKIIRRRQENICRGMSTDFGNRRERGKRRGWQESVPKLRVVGRRSLRSLVPPYGDGDWIFTNDRGCKVVSVA